MTLPKVYVLGDSISMQYGPYLEAYCKGQFDYDRKQGDEGYDDLDIPAGANGGNSGMVLRFLQQQVSTHGAFADFILINAGLHDIKIDTEAGDSRQVEIDQYEENLEAIVDCVESSGMVMIWIRSTPVDSEIHNARKRFRRYSEDLEAYNKVADRVMNANDVPDIDLYRFTCNLGPLKDLFCDHVHFTETVREKQGAYIAGYLDGIAEHL